jgi:uncharacterized membrane protein
MKIIKRNRVPRIILYPALAVWFLFLPNSPYIITDLVHLFERPPVPFWFDMLLVLLSAVNGLVLGFVSIRQIEQIFIRRNAVKYLVPFRMVVVLAMSYGVYLGRYLRFNSWDAILNPLDVLSGILMTFKISTVGFVLTFSFVTYMLYWFFQSILHYHSQEAS